MINCGVGPDQRFDRAAAVKFCISLSEYDLFTDYSLPPAACLQIIPPNARLGQQGCAYPGSPGPFFRIVCQACGVYQEDGGLLCIPGNTYDGICAAQRAVQVSRAIVRGNHGHGSRQKSRSLMTLRNDCLIRAVTTSQRACCCFTAPM